jgi:hypothetical protein
MHPSVQLILRNPKLRAQVERALASRGRGGDTLIAHLNPREAAMLKASGGSGTINPRTGLREFADDSASSKGVEHGTDSGGRSPGDAGYKGGGGYRVRQNCVSGCLSLSLKVSRASFLLIFQSLPILPRPMPSTIIQLSNVGKYEGR